MDLRRRWTDFNGETLGVDTQRYRDCERCGGFGEVLGGTKVRGDVDRRLRCSCGRTWRQIIAG